MLAVDTDILKLTTDDLGKVWFLSGKALPQSSTVKLSEFLANDVLHYADFVRVVAFPKNIKLILALYQAKQAGLISKLEVCSPVCCEDVSVRSDPACVLYCMRKFNLPASLGGWHEFNGNDYHSYRLADMHYSGEDVTLDDCKRHPAWRAASFVEDLNPACFVEVLATILDPRWFIDLVDPNSNTRLDQLFGLNPKVQAGVSLRGESGLPYKRCAAVMNSWKKVMPKAKNKKPGYFLWKVWAEAGGGYKGDLRASKAFLHYLRWTWLDAITEGAHRGRLFVPNYFFSTVAEVAAYQNHMLSRLI